MLILRLLNVMFLSLALMAAWQVYAHANGTHPPGTQPPTSTPSYTPPPTQTPGVIKTPKPSLSDLRYDCQRAHDIRIDLVRKHLNPRLADLRARGMELNWEVERLQGIQANRALSMGEKKVLANKIYELQEAEEAFRKLLREKIDRENKINQDLKDCLMRLKGIQVPYR